MHLHFATRSFAEVKEVAKALRLRAIKPTARCTLVMLKTALQELEFR